MDGGNTAAGDGWNLAKRLLDLDVGNAWVAAGALDQLGGHALVVVEQGLEQVLRPDPLVALADRNGLRGLKETLGAVSELLEIHAVSRLLLVVR